MTAGLYEFPYAIAYVTFAIKIFSSFARFCSRALVVRSWGWDDTASCAVLTAFIEEIVMGPIVRTLSRAGSDKWQSDQPHKLSPMKDGARNKAFMGYITRLERGISTNESADGLCQSKPLQAQLDVK